VGHKIQPLHRYLQWSIVLMEYIIVSHIMLFHIRKYSLLEACQHYQSHVLLLLAVTCNLTHLQWLGEVMNWGRGKWTCFLVVDTQLTASIFATASLLCAQCKSVSKHKCRLTSVHCKHREHFQVTRYFMLHYATGSNSRVILLVESFNKRHGEIMKSDCHHLYVIRRKR
jgi:hypothetical protein